MDANDIKARKYQMRVTVHYFTSGYFSIPIKYWVPIFQKFLCREVSYFILGQDTDYPEGFHGFPQSSREIPG
jgi:hypothetical protein